jgi:hypothetical protein
MVTPCIGVPALHIPPMCTWAELGDGTYTLADVQLFWLVYEAHNNG